MECREVTRRIVRRGLLPAVLFVVTLSALDALTTLLGIHHGVFRELNPVLSLSLTGPLVCFYLLKGGLTALWAAIMLRESGRRWLKPVCAGIAGGYALVVARNLILLI